MRNRFDRWGWLAVSLLVGGFGCVKKPTEKYYYDQHIQPILTQSCTGNTSPCHRVDPATGTALGNLDLTSYESVHKRPDVLRKYGSYPYPLLLLKAIPEASIQIPYRGNLVQSEITHVGGKSLSTDSDAFFTLATWLENGATLDGIAPPAAGNHGQGACNTALPPDRDLTVVNTGSAAYQAFTTDVMPKLKTSCAFATCHSSPQSDFYITCGDDDSQMRFNFLQASDFVAPAGTAPEQSEILLRPLAPSGGGVSHTGGIFFTSRSDATWLKWKDWAVAVQADPIAAATPESTGQIFFEANVMPILLKRGCALEGCHSPDGFNDFRLRPGAQGFFAPSALKRNYETLINEFMAVDSIDVRQSRAVKKNIFPVSGGITHRAGALLETGSAMLMNTTAPDSARDCPPFDPANPTTSTAFCTFTEWHRLERVDRAAAVSPLASGDKVPLAYVVRPPDPDSLLAFDTFRGGADLMVADATLGARGAVTAVGNARSVLAGCAGLTAGTADVRGPEWSYDGTKLVFAGRPSAASGLDLWMIDLGAGGACTQLTADGGRLQGDVKVHNFDPVFAPNGAVVFASTRSGTWTQKTFLPNSDLFRSGPNGDFTPPIEQMTFLLNSELSPAFMQDGRLSFTAEKASPEFYQISGRRMNWDLTDYHPLLAQRAQSTDTFSDVLHPSVGYSQATEIREGLDRNFLVILSDVGAQGGAGALATFNRSVGPFEADRPEASFLKSMQILDPAATGRAGTVGAYRSPFSLPDGRVLVSYAANVTDPATDVPKYDLVAFDLTAAAAGTSPRAALLSDPSRSIVEATLGYKRAETALFRNLPQLVFGGHSGDVAGIMHFPDVPMVATLLGANLRRGRDVQAMDAAVALKVYQDIPPPSANPGGLVGSQAVYSNRQAIGSAAFESDHSLKVYVPVKTPLILELVDGSGNPVFTMTEEHQVSAGEYVTPGVPRNLFNGICGGCHGSISGEELDVAVTPDALTGASVSLSRDQDPKPLQ
jgi:hypothetical protein